MAVRQLDGERTPRGWPTPRSHRRLAALTALTLAVLLLAGGLGVLTDPANAARRIALDTRLSRASVRELTIVSRGATGGPVISSPAVAGGVVYVGSNDGFLYAFDAKGGAGCDLFTCVPRWRGATGGPVSSSPVVAGGLVFVGSWDGKLYAFDRNHCAAARTCGPTWVGNTGGPVMSSPTVANGVVYVGSSDGRLYAFNAGGCNAPGGSCAPMWRTFTSGPVSSSPTVASGLVYVGSENRRLYAYRRDRLRGSTRDSVPGGVARGDRRPGAVVARGRERRGVRRVR